MKSIKKFIEFNEEKEYSLDYKEQDGNYFTEPGETYHSPKTKKDAIIPEYSVTEIGTGKDISFLYNDGVCKIYKSKEDGSWYFKNYKVTTDKERNNDDFNKHLNPPIKCNSKLHAMFLAYDKINSLNNKSFGNWVSDINNGKIKPKESYNTIDDIKVDETVIDTKNGSDCKIRAKSHNTIGVSIKAKTDKNVYVTRWFNMKEFNSRFKKK